MTFAEALELMKQGRSVIRTTWGHQEQEIRLEGEGHRAQIVSRRLVSDPFPLMAPDMLADDWAEKT